MDWQTLFAGVVAVTSIATAVGVLFGARQVALTKQQLELVKSQAATDFEDDISREYRSIIQNLPPHAFFATEPDALTEDELKAFFRYFDLSNEQLWLAEQRRVRQDTAADWRDGIVANLGLPAFAAAWKEITPNLGSDYWTLLRHLLRVKLEYP